MKHFILVAALLFAVACKPSATTPAKPSYPPPTRLVNPFEVLSAMSETNVSANNFSLPDAQYVIPTLRWVTEDFSAGLWQFQHEMGIATWVAESNDCDKFSIAASFYAKWLNHSSANRNVAAGLAIGELYYLKGGVAGQGHAINFFVVQVGESLQIVTYEPQTRSIVTLTETERASVFFWKL